MIKQAGEGRETLACLSCNERPYQHMAQVVNYLNINTNVTASRQVPLAAGSAKRSPSLMQRLFSDLIVFGGVLKECTQLAQVLSLPAQCAC